MSHLLTSGQPTQKRIFKIDIGDIPSEEVNKYIKQFQDNLRTMPITNSKSEHLMTEIEKLSPEQEEEFEAKLMEDFKYYAEAYPLISVDEDIKTFRCQRLRVLLQDNGEFKMSEIFFELMHLLNIDRKRGIKNPRCTVKSLKLSKVIYDPNGFAPRRGIMIEWNVENDGKEEKKESTLLTSGQVGKIGLNYMKQIRQNTVNQWEKLGFLEGLKGQVKQNIAQMYEGKASHMLNEVKEEPITLKTKMKTTLDKGMVYTPYIPVMMTGEKLEIKRDPTERY